MICVTHRTQHLESICDQPKAKREQKFELKRKRPARGVVPATTAERPRSICAYSLDKLIK